MFAPRLIESLRRPTRYVQVGLLCALLNNLIVVGFDQAGLHYTIGVASAFVGVTAIGYLLHSAYTFRVRPRLSGLLKFFAANFVGLCWSMLLMIMLCGGLGLRASLAMPLVTVVLFGWNYTTAHWAVLKHAK